MFTFFIQGIPDIVPFIPNGNLSFYPDPYFIQFLSNERTISINSLADQQLISSGNNRSINFLHRLQKSYQQFESDSQLKHAISSLYVIDARTGEVVFDKNSQVGLAGASTQKIITATTAFELLGKEYKYKTEFWWAKSLPNFSNLTNILIKPSGDPTLGSWRFSTTNSNFISSELRERYTKYGLKVDELSYSRYLDKFETQIIPDSWIFQDIGNYYGAGAAGFN